MNNTYDIAKIIEKAFRFIAFVQHMDKRKGNISFRDSTGILGREEDYKSRIAEEARTALKYSNWKEDWIGTGKIAECAVKAMNKASNLVNKNQQIDFKNRLDPNDSKYQADGERALFDLYRNPSCEDAIAFANVVKVFGAKYDTIAFLFFVKDDSRFLPISPGHFDKGFSLLGIEYTTSFGCSWENYMGFISIISDIRTILEDVLPMNGTPRLIDAHSFVWVIQENRFNEWTPNTKQSQQIESTTEDYIQNSVAGSGGRRKRNSNYYIRSAAVVKETRKRARGVCQLCNHPAPFKDKKGEPYLEVHHITWLSRGGKDSTNNTVALCPNCHTRMHVLDKMEDIEKLKAIVDSKGQPQD